MFVEKITARVFCGRTTRTTIGRGGNPVTIFASPQDLSASLRTKLAKSCDWESVVVQSSAKTMSFHMPSGEEVSFCAHAAIGGAVVMGPRKPEGSLKLHHWKASMTGDEFRVDTVLKNTALVGCLYMDKVFFREERLTDRATETLKAWSDRLDWKQSCEGIPKNACVARPKTLVELESVEAVHSAKTPFEDPSSFAKACSKMDDSTGVYLYAVRSESPKTITLECRQFPRSSGYPEDPATGIAAAALAASLEYANESKRKLYDIIQGTAMGRPSLIQVLNLQLDDQKLVSFGLQGNVEIDDQCTIEIQE